MICNEDKQTVVLECKELTKVYKSLWIGRTNAVCALTNISLSVTEEVDSFRSNAKLFGFESSDLGREFIFQGQPYTICGFKPRSRKYPVIARSGNGKDYKFACRTILGALGREVPDWL